MSPELGIALKLVGGTSIFACLVAFVWNWDKKLTASVVGAFSSELSGDGQPLANSADDVVKELLHSSYASSQPFGTALASVIWTSIVSLFLMTVFYFMLIPDLAQAFFFRDDYDLGLQSLKRFIQTWLPTGFLTILGVTYVSHMILGAWVERISQAGIGGTVRFILFDLFVKMALTLPITAALYAFYAVAYDSFGGSAAAGVAAVPQTIAGAFLMQNLSGAYVHACLITGFPLFLALLVRLSSRSMFVVGLWQRLDRLVDTRDKPLRYLGFLLAGFSAVLGVVASLAFGTGAEAFGIAPR